ncbi:ABC transporter substrate-binding protein [Streptomyces kaniharaensis]|uniref:ABC transporter substrate-binding protein n=1 Tax=Streptomyces kaniharaensis TaxID=212423 RepID=A0A6N7L5T0_9ACTN|nr:ABC transporter substrate-binding protein [Streptomyces kaniharaensis]MQS17784.1 ABC transporter substrate-binding protein [Streptomyces kaniharaensis]
MPKRRSPRARPAALVLTLALALTACGSGGSGAGPTTLDWYNFPDDSGALQQAADTCGQASGGRYAIRYNKLPRTADGQRQQLVRRLAAHDAGVDIMGLDVTWAPEFAEAGWIREWTGAQKEQVTADTLPAALRTATWKDRLYAAPYNSNTQLLWYRDDLTPSPPRTWAELLAQADALAKDGKPHDIEVQGAQYEGLTVWFNTLVGSAGGAVLTTDATAPALGAPAVTAAGIIRELARSAAADPSLANQMEDQNRLALESGTAAFEVNYPFVYPAMKADRPDLFAHFRWAPYPAVTPDRPAAVTIGGIDLAVGAYSRHPDLAREATLCLRNRDNQLVNALRGGLPPSLRSLYTAPELTADYPFAAEVLAALESASLRPQTPAYQNVSIAIAHALSPPSAVDPEHTVAALHGQIGDALGSKGLIP